MNNFDTEMLKTLASFDTPTVCNALEIVVPERRGTGYTVEHLHCLHPDLGPIVGFARTATYRSVLPGPESAEETRAKRAAYYEYLASPPGPTVVVIQDLDPTPGFGAFWGEVNTAVHKGLGALGCVTNGSMRDLPDSAPGFQLLAGKIGPSHAYGHIVNFGGEVNVVGMHVRHGDLIHADRHGAVVIPHVAAARIPEAADLIARREAVILKAARAPNFNIEKLKQAMAEQSEIH